MSKIKVSSKEVFKAYKELTEDEKFLYEEGYNRGWRHGGLFILLIMVVLMIMIIVKLSK